MRIVAGKFGSRNLKTLKGHNTRPSSSKVRAAVYDHLGSFFNQGSMLDMFSGSGAMAIEAISRGFEKAVCIEKNRKAYQVIKDNIELLDLEQNVELILGDAERTLLKLDSNFDLIYIDPPYGFAKSESVLQLVSKQNLLASEGICIFETNQLDDKYKNIDGLLCYQQKNYGEAKLYFYKRAD